MLCDLGLANLLARFNSLIDFIDINLLLSDFSFFSLTACSDQFFQAQEKLGPVDMLVNCAGMSLSGKFEELEVSTFEVSKIWGFLAHRGHPYTKSRTRQWVKALQMKQMKCVQISWKLQKTRGRLDKILVPVPRTSSLKG